jgi:carbon-monoxide dehydrogenase small subunit
VTAIAFSVNGRKVEGAVEPRTHLADFLRETLHLTGTHLRCEQGVCGACTLLLDGAPARSCITFAVSCAEAEITTIEGLEHDPIIEKLRDAFSREHGLQCGFCTPGMLITARDIVTRLPNADESRVRRELSGNLCRCTGYGGIVRAISRVLEEQKATNPVDMPIRSRLGPVGARLTPIAINSPPTPGIFLRQKIAPRLIKVWSALFGKAAADDQAQKAR